MTEKLTKSISSKKKVKQIAPKTKSLQPNFKSKILELIAKDVSNLWAEKKLINLLIDCGINKKFIKKSKIKWRMVYNILQILNISDEISDRQILFRVIEEAVHPLAHEGDGLSSQTLLNKFNGYLSYNRTYITFNEEEGRYRLYSQLTEKEQNEILTELDQEDDKRAKEQLKFLNQPNNKKKIFLLLIIFQLLMDTVKIFCTDPSNPTKKLNNIYQSLNQQIWDIIHDLDLRGDTMIYNFNSYKILFVNLFSAEKQYAEQNKELSWKKIKPEMNAMYGQINNICQKMNVDNTVIDLKEHKKLNNIQSYLSGLEEKMNKEKEKEEKQQRKNEYKGISIKNKIPRDTIWEDITIRFLNSCDVKIFVRNVEIGKYNNQKMGCFLLTKKDYDNNEDKSWEFLQKLSTSNGEYDMTIYKNNIRKREKYSQRKKKLSDNLKKFFGIEEAPINHNEIKCYYKTMFKIEPEGTVRGKGEIYGLRDAKKRYKKKEI